MESAGGAAYFFPWCQLNFVTYRWAILGAITSFPSCLAAEYCLERDRFWFCFFFGFCTNGTLATSPIVADLCPGWGMKGFSVLYQSSFASWQIKVSSGTWRSFLLLHWHVASPSRFNRIQDTGGLVPIISLYSKHLENRWASAGTHIHSQPLVNLTHLYYYRRHTGPPPCLQSLSVLGRCPWEIPQEWIWTPVASRVPRDPELSVWSQLILRNWSQFQGIKEGSHLSVASCTLPFVLSLPFSAQGLFSLVFWRPVLISLHFKCFLTSQSSA